MSFEVRPTRVLTLGPSPNAFGALENHSLSRLGFLLQFGGYSSAHLVVSSLELKKKARKKGQTWPSRQGSGGAVYSELTGHPLTSSLNFYYVPINEPTKRPSY